MKHAMITLFSVLILFPCSSYAAQAPAHACALLTPAEIGSAVGGQVGPSQESNVTIPNGPSQGQTMAGCMWKVGERDMVSINVIPALQGADREAGLAGLNKVYEGLKAKGWTEDKRTIGIAKCSSMTPPPAQRDVPLMSGCMAEAKGLALSVGSMSPTKQAAMEQLKTLLDKVTARLP